ncbi:MAG: hypothetical protein PHR84_06085 [Candidatus Omnitrophica bacterium]|nr:hypothetical protein [Candidatus Omnitrophota bacterium]
MKSLPVIIFFILLAVLSVLNEVAAQEEFPPYRIPVLIVKYFPLTQEKNRIDIQVTGDWGEPLEQTRNKADDLTKKLISTLEQGSIYHGYKNSLARPSLKYVVVGNIEFLEPLPVFYTADNNIPMTDYNKIMERIGIRKWVLENGVKEVWIWAYHGGIVRIWESNMSGPYGDISNSDRNPNDLPVLNKTYTVYHYNYQRGLSEATEDHMHQIEAVLRSIDSSIFWDKFVGGFSSNNSVARGEHRRRCGWSHYPPNGQRDYDWKNKDYVWTDIEDWRPDGGREQRMNCERWGCDSLKWFIYWMQNIPGADNGIMYNNRKLNNWWVFIGDFDYALEHKLGLIEN